MKKKNEPGPGHYGFEDKRDKGAEFTMGKLTTRNPDNGIPGPNKYQARSFVGREGQSKSMA